MYCNWLADIYIIIFELLFWEDWITCATLYTGRLKDSLRELFPFIMWVFLNQTQVFEFDCEWLYPLGRLTGTYFFVFSNVYFLLLFYSVRRRKENVFYREAHSMDFVGCIPVATSERDSEQQSHSDHRETRINWWLFKGPFLFAKHPSFFS